VLTSFIDPILDLKKGGVGICISYIDDDKLKLFAHFKKLMFFQVQNPEEIFVAVSTLVRFFPGMLSLMFDLKQVKVGLKLNLDGLTCSGNVP
jgi:hypothetical protein